MARWPLNSFTITQGFSASHPGNDLAAPSGTKILTPESGVIDGINNNPTGYFGGLYVTMKGKSGRRYYMGHNSKNRVKVGQKVNQSEHIADVGSTGQSTGPHVHFQVWETNGKLIDPSKAGLRKGEEMLTGQLAAILVRAFCGRAITDKEKKDYVGKETADKFADRVKTWGTHKQAVKDSKDGSLIAKNFLMGEIREGFPAVKAKDVGGNYEEVKEKLYRRK